SWLGGGVPIAQHGPVPAEPLDSRSEASPRCERRSAGEDISRALGPPVPEGAGDVTLPDFDAQCDAFLDAAPPAVSSIIGVFPSRFVERLKARRIAWFATATTLAEARTARDAGADAIIAQGIEAGGHRGSFDAARAEQQGIGLVALVPR